jgi:hypothetical protein
VNAVFFGALIKTTEPVITTSASTYRPTADTEEGIRILISKNANAKFSAHRCGRVYYPPIRYPSLSYQAKVAKHSPRQTAAGGNQPWKPFIMCVM